MNTRWLRALCAGALALSSLLAHAQYSWIDDKGTRVFSDQPPPPGTPAARILRTPRGLAPAPAPAAQGAPAALTPDWKKREAEYRERSAQRDKEERETEAKRRQERDAQCTWARGAQKKLETARRLSWTNKKGQQEDMSDEARAGEQLRVQKILANCG
ncbi:DUF4124 domain-containing protein [Massilia norwichensis]|uniref:DUF4124 domain-containing protein n=1 Tax=Massilia norwichensis TaxID=1442366 RepID=A0ABT2A0A9_9BURK|nr:DUF4124 domain-containing protein [Massilia norwichensis]MCS0587615.1 DUF4124 domain-containing protein [Massilia norwichensis]